MTPLAALCALSALGGCGSGTKVVTVSSAPHGSSGESTTTATTKTAPPSPTKTTAPTSTSGGTTAPSATRTAPAPAFTHTEGAGGSGASAAATVVREHGYTADSTSDYHPEQTLTVLIGTRTGSGDGYDQRAFFFLEGKYIGTDAKQPSAQVKVVSQSDTEVTLAYSLYHPKDPLCCPSAGQAQVTFQLNNGKLAPAQQIPPASSSTLPSRL